LKKTDVSELRADSVIRATMKAVRTSETSVYFDETTRRYMPEGWHIHIPCSDNLKSHNTARVTMLCRLIRSTGLNNKDLEGRAMAQAISRRPLTAEARVRVRVKPCGVCGGKSGTEIGFSPSSSVFSCQYNIPPSLFSSYHMRDEQYVV